MQTGDVATDLQRPLDVQRAALRAGRRPRRATSCVWRRVPQFLLGALLFEITDPRPTRAGCSFAVQRRAGRRRQLRDPVPRQPLRRSGCSTTAARCSSRSRSTFVLSGVIIPLAFFPGAVRDARRALTPFASMLQAPIDIYVGEPLGGSVALVLAAPGRSGRLVLVRRRPVRARAPARGSWCCRVGELRAARSTCGSSAPACAASSSTASRRRCSSSARCSRPPLDFVAIVVIFANVPELGELDRAGGRAPVRARDDLVRVHRPRDRAPRPAPADDPRGHVRPDPRAAAAVALPAGRRRTSPLRRLGKAPAGGRRARRTRSSSRTSTGRSAACSRSRSRSPPAR